MLKISAVLSILFTLICLDSFSQFKVGGKVIDAATREPLSGASVYCQNTTVGTVTNKEGEFVLDLKSGGYDLIVSYTGYLTRVQNITHTDVAIPDIELQKEEKSLGEVVVKTSNEVKDGWVKYGSFFLEHFVGNTPNANQTTLLNPEVLKFYFLKRSNKLRVLAEEPLQIENKALGYNIRYQLDSFIYFYNTDINLYRGYSLFMEMEGTDSIKRVWTRNRANAYEGSKLQFMRSYYDSTLVQDGWAIGLLDENNDKKFNNVKDVYDTLYYGAMDSTQQIEIFYPRKISVSYSKKRPEPEYLKKYKLPKDVLLQISYIDLADAIAITQNGYYYEQKDWTNQGYWSWKNLADQLPYDY